MSLQHCESGHFSFDALHVPRLYVCPESNFQRITLTSYHICWTQQMTRAALLYNQNVENTTSKMVLLFYFFSRCVVSFPLPPGTSHIHLTPQDSFGAASLTRIQAIVSNVPLKLLHIIVYIWSFSTCPPLQQFSWGVALYVCDGSANIVKYTQHLIQTPASVGPEPRVHLCRLGFLAWYVK